MLVKGSSEMNQHRTINCIKVPKYLEWVLECSKKHSEKKLAQKNTQQIKSTFLSPQIIAQ